MRECRRSGRRRSGCGARGARKSSTVSSESQPASGNASSNRRLSSESAARSAAVTGEPPAFVSTWAEVRAPGLKYSSATAPASRAADAKRSRAASASMSASTLKGGMSAAKEGSQLGFSRADGGAQSRNARDPALVSGFDPRHSAAPDARSAQPEQKKVLIWRPLGSMPIYVKILELVERSAIRASGRSAQEARQ